MYVSYLNNDKRKSKLHNFSINDIISNHWLHMLTINNDITNSKLQVIY